MPLNLASPGIVVREVDLTSGRVQPASNKVGAIVAPFAKGPVDSPTLVENENDLLNNFGEPYSTDKHYESWMVASSYLSYGGSLQVVRADDADLKNAFVGTASSVKIKSLDHYEELGYDENTITGVTVAARNPGSWANGVKVAIIDSKADQILSGISTTSVTNTTFVGVATASDGDVGITTTQITGITTNGVGNVIVAGQTLKIESGIIDSGTTVSSIGVGAVFLNKPTLNAISLTNVQLSFGSYTSTTTGTTIRVGYGVTQSLTGKTDTSSGSSVSLTGSYLKGIITEIGVGSVAVKILSRVSSGNTETIVDYQQDGTYCFTEGGTVGIVTSGTGVTLGSAAYTSEDDWFGQQSITLTNSNIQWSSLAPAPGTSAFAEPRGSRFDEVHVVVIDDLGTITGNAGTILEKHLGLSKATDAEFSAGSTSYWRKYIAAGSANIFAGGAPTGLTTTGYDAGQFDLTTDNGWDQAAENVIFGAAGSNTYTLGGGVNYAGTSSLTSAGALTATLAELKGGYDLLENTEEIKVDFILMGSAGYAKEIAQELANKIISVSELRKDAIAFISPYRGSALTDTEVETEVTIRNSTDITNNVISFFSPIVSSSYAVFDSGYKYMYDRFANTYRYVPLNGDIAGLCARNDINYFPWYSPAGTSRGAILNAVKLAYTPSKSQRDRLYSNRINPIIFSPGSGIILFGDKTGLLRTSAFDRINVRRLFIYVEDAISRAAKDVLFEFNDEITRTNFVNTIEPFLRDVQAKRGIFDYVVVCDETNNTAAVIDANEFRADIYIKPARSINFIGLTFIATKTGVDFEEVIGNF
jgi:phage tail sheath protein FI